MFLLPIKTSVHSKIISMHTTVHSLGNIGLVYQKCLTMNFVFAFYVKVSLKNIPKN